MIQTSGQLISALSRMTPRQRTALLHHCRLAGECVHPQFQADLHGGLSLILTVNSGYE